MDQIHFGKPVTGNRALYSVSGLVEDSGAIISVSGQTWHQSSWSGLDLRAFWKTWAETPSIPFPVGFLLVAPSFPFPEHVGWSALFSISGLLAPKWTWQAAAHAQMAAGPGRISQRGIHVQTKECVWNGVLIRSQHATAKTYCHPSIGWLLQQGPSMGCGACACSLSYGGLCNWSARSSITFPNWALAWLAFTNVWSPKRRAAEYRSADWARSANGLHASIFFLLKIVFRFITFDNDFCSSGNRLS